MGMQEPMMLEEAGYCRPGSTNHGTLSSGVSSQTWRGFSHPPRRASSVREFGGKRRREIAGSAIGARILRGVIVCLRSISNGQCAQKFQRPEW